MEQLEDPLAIATVKKELDKRKMKREWQRRKKLNLAKETEEAISRRIEMNREIDEKREIIRQKHASELRVKNDFILNKIKDLKFYVDVSFEGSQHASRS